MEATEGGNEGYDSREEGKVRRFDGPIRFHDNGAFIESVFKALVGENLPLHIHHETAGRIVLRFARGGWKAYILPHQDIVVGGPNPSQHPSRPLLNKYLQHCVTLQVIATGLDSGARDMAPNDVVGKLMQYLVHLLADFGLGANWERVGSEDWKCVGLVKVRTCATIPTLAKLCLHVLQGRE